MRSRNIVAQLLAILLAASAAIAPRAAAQQQCGPITAIQDITVAAAIAAVKLNCVPNICPSGQAPQGIDVNGNAIFCNPISTSAAGGGGGVPGSGQIGQVTFWQSTGSVTGDDGLFWDNTDKRLGIGALAPTFPLEIHGAIDLDPNNAIASKFVLFNAFQAGTPNSVTYGSFDIASNALNLNIGPGVPNMGIMGGFVGIGTDAPTSTFTVAGLVESTDGGYKFPDGSIQTTAAGGAPVPFTPTITCGTGSPGTVTQDGTYVLAGPHLVNYSIHIAVGSGTCGMSVSVALPFTTAAYCGFVGIENNVTDAPQLGSSFANSTSVSLTGASGSFIFGVGYDITASGTCQL